MALAGAVLTGQAYADPAEDALAKLNDLSRQAEQTTEAMHSAQLDLDNKLAIQQAAETKHASDVAAMESAKAQLGDFQGKVDKLAAAQYMGGRASGFDAILTASSPQGLIDQLSVQRVMAGEKLPEPAAAELGHDTTAPAKPAIPETREERIARLQALLGEEFNPAVTDPMFDPHEAHKPRVPSVDELREAAA